MGIFSDSIAIGARRGRVYAESLLKDITARNFARKPSFGGTVIDCNHPAFVYGHLGLYGARVLDLSGLSGSSIAAPAGWEDLFKAGAPCRDDPEGTIYPAMDDLTAHFFKSYDAAIAALPTVGDDRFAMPNPNEKSRETFPTVGGVVGFLMGSHLMLHLGQISTWRRCMGLGSAM
jgi:DinB superfamily